MKRIFKYLTSILLVALVLVVLLHDVSTRLSKADREAISGLLEEIDIDKGRFHSDYAYQVEVIAAIQRLVMDTVDRGVGIPLSQSREPSDQLKIGEGECYDRSRLLEKTFSFLGIKNRHLSIYLRVPGVGPLKSLASSGHPSHATSEVRTLKGWLLVDSNYEWLSLDSDGLPMSMKKLDPDRFQSKPERVLIPFYEPENIVVYGLFSRHGKFYRPYSPVPDYNLRQLLYNF